MGEAKHASRQVEEIEGVLTEVAGLFHLSPNAIDHRPDDHQGPYGGIRCALPPGMHQGVAVLVEILGDPVEGDRNRVVVHRPPFMSRPASGEGLGVSLPLGHEMPRRWTRTRLVDTSEATWADSLREWMCRVLAGPEPTPDRPAASVGEVIRDYRGSADRMEFADVMDHLTLDAELGWFLLDQAGGRGGSRDLLKVAVTRELALAQTLQQLGHLEGARRRFRRLLRRLGIPRSGLGRLRRRIDEETGDDALALHFRLIDSRLGRDDGVSGLDEALATVRLPRNRSKFLWRQRVGRLAAGRPNSLDGFEDEYRSLTDDAAGAAWGNILLVRQMDALFGGRYEEAARIMVEARRSTEELWRRMPDYAHLATHVVLSSVYQEVRVKRLVAMRRGVRDDGRDRELPFFVEAARNLRDDAAVGVHADGFREYDQLMAALFERLNFGWPATAFTSCRLDSVWPATASTDPVEWAKGLRRWTAGPKSRHDRLDHLCKWADSYHAVR